jgi:hypothetical protein
MELGVLLMTNSKITKPPVQVVVQLPTWEQCDEKNTSSPFEMTELETFIWQNEPAYDDAGSDEYWRAHLAEVLAEAINEDRWARL